MSIRQLIEILNDIEDKDLKVMLPTELGFHLACIAESGIAKDHEGKPLFVLLPCLCHLDNLDESDAPIEVEVRVDDFDEYCKN